MMRSPRTPSTDARPARRILTRLGSSRMARETSWAFVAELVRMFTQLAIFLVITHIYSARDYGIYVGTLGLMAFAFQFATFGASHVLLRRVAGGGTDPGRAMSRGTSTVILGGLITVPLLLVLRPWILPQTSIAVLATLAVTELVLAGVQDLAVFVAQATHNIRASVPIRLAVGLTRLAAVLVLWGTVSSPTLVQLTTVSLVASVIATAISLLVLPRNGIHMGRPRRPSGGDLREGIPFSIGFGADKLRESADSVLLLRLDRQVDAGVYGASTRLVDMAVVPLRSLGHAANARLFEAGRESIRSGRRMAVHVTAAALAYAVPVGALMALLGPTAIRVLPSSYQSAGEAVRLLALWPAAVALEMFVGTALTAVGHHRIRVVTNVASAALNIALNLLWIPDHGWRGSVAATMATSFLSSVVMWTALHVVGRRNPRHAALPEPDAQPADAAAIARR